MSIVKDNTEQRKFELVIDGSTTFANYRLDGAVLYINYVEAPEVLRGTGAAGRLMEGIVQIAKDRSYKVVPICGYAQSWFKRHSEYQDLLAV